MSKDIKCRNDSLTFDVQGEETLFFNLVHILEFILHAARRIADIYGREVIETRII